MKIIFFEVDGVLNFSESDAVAPSGAKGVAEAKVKELKKIIQETGARLVLIGSWRKNWDFDTEKCSPDGIYLNKKLERRGLHILDKIKDEMTDEDGMREYINKRPNVTDSCVLNKENLPDGFSYETFKKIRWDEW